MTPGGEDEYRANIILIHGFGDNVRNTWTGSDGTFWPTDLLPQSLPGIKVLAFQYEADDIVIRPSAGLQNAADQVLQILAVKTMKGVRCTSHP